MDVNVMQKRLTFKEYLATKDQLRNSIQKTPQQTIEYEIIKYCKLIVGESKEEKTKISLKPKQIIIIEWLYNDLNNPTALNIVFEQVSSCIDSQEYNNYWNPSKLQKWLSTNTRLIQH